MKRAAKALLWAAAVLLAVGVVGKAAGFVWAVSDCLPSGLYRTSTGPLTRGATVALCAPPTVRFRLAVALHLLDPGECPGGMPVLIKPVMALPGDQVEITEQGITVNGTPIPNTRPITTSSTQPEVLEVLRPLAKGTYTVQANEMWVLSSYNPRTWDSRYFGPIPLATITALAHPVFTYRKP